MSASSQFIDAILRRKRARPENSDAWQTRLKTDAARNSPPVSFADHPHLTELKLLRAAADRLGIGDPFFKVHEGSGGARTKIGGKEYINFSHYNYLGMNGDPAVNDAAIAAVREYGTSAGASRLVAGERPIQRELEKALAQIYNAQDCAVFVSGHATNVSAISTLFGAKDLVIHDSLIHNSVLEGIRASGATRRSFPHNDTNALESLLEGMRHNYERTLIVVEGVYSMDGDLPDLHRLVELKSRYRAFLMVDEAHALGVLGETGRGSAEHFGMDPRKVDIWMGTLSKTLAACGGYIAGSQDLIDILKAAAPGFVFSVGISPPLAAAALKSVELMLREPERIRKLHENSMLFLDLARRAGLNTGSATGNAIIPVILGSSRKAIALSNKLFENGINVQPIIHPAVEEKASRLRFFLSSRHTGDDISKCCEITAKLAGAKGETHA